MNSAKRISRASRGKRLCSTKRRYLATAEITGTFLCEMVVVAGSPAEAKRLISEGKGGLANGGSLGFRRWTKRDSKVAAGSRIRRVD